MLSHLSTVSDPGEEAWVLQFNNMRSVPSTYFTVVVVDTRTDRIIATGSIVVERKFTHGFGAIGRLEDVVVDRVQQRGHIGLCLVKVLGGISDEMGCFKITGNCLDRNMGMYTSCTHFILAFIESPSIL